MSRMIAGIDVHKKMLMVVVADASLDLQDQEFSGHRFGTAHSELIRLADWLTQQGVKDVVMESTAQYWKPVWLALEPSFNLHLAQAQSNRAPKGRKTDFRDTERLVRRFIAGELMLSFVPDAAQREVRMLARRRVQLVRNRVSLKNQLESLLEECSIKLSSIISDLTGATGLRILGAIAAGKTSPTELAALGDERLKCTKEELADALRGRTTANHQKVLEMILEDFKLLDAHIEKTTELIAATIREHQAAVMRLCQIPGIRVVAAQQIIAEIGATAKAFESAGQLASWAGVCPGQQESAGDNRSSRCAKGNRFLRSLLCQCAQAAVKTKESFYQATFQRLLPRLGFAKAIWAIAHKLLRVIWNVLHDNQTYKERGATTSPQALKRRLQRLRQECRKLGYDVQLVPNTEVPA